jgi:hypothetical protein
MLKIDRLNKFLVPFVSFCKKDCGRRNVGKFWHFVKDGLHWSNGVTNVFVPLTNFQTISDHGVLPTSLWSKFVEGDLSDGVVEIVRDVPNFEGAYNNFVDTNPEMVQIHVGLQELKNLVTLLGSMGKQLPFYRQTVCISLPKHKDSRMMKFEIENLDPLARGLEAILCAVKKEGKTC